MSIELQFTDEDWERIRRDWSLWWAGELNRPMVVIENPMAIPMGMQFTQEFLLEKPVEEVLDHQQAMLEVREFYGDAWPKWWPNYGPGIMAGFLGAKVHGDPEMETVWFEPPDTKAIDEIRFAFDAENVWWKRIVELTRGAVERWGSKVSVAHTDLGGNLDIVASFRTTQNLLFDVIDSPDEVTRLVNGITALWLRYYDELWAIIQKAGRGTTPWAPIWSPGRCYMFQSDFCYMVSPQMFEKFVLPDIEECTEKMDHGFYHLDGKGQILHLDMLLSLEKLAGIQWIPGDGAPPPEEWLPLLKRIRDAGKLCQVFVSAEGAQTIVRELGGRGFAFFIMSFITSREEAGDLLKTLGC
jgi:5-methyltetrahydrofolate--homocysteine methyltransferase